MLPRRKRLRMDTFDYSTPGCYFVTIPTSVRKQWFGMVSNGSLHLNSAGRMVLRVWSEITDRFAGTMIDAVIVMPDHVHGIIMLGTNPAVATHPSLSEVIGAFKSITTVEYGRGARDCGWPPYRRNLWQRSYRDTIIRSDRALDQFRAYIEGNPGGWAEK